MADRQAPGRIAAQVMIGPSPCYIDDGDYVGGFRRADMTACWRPWKATTWLVQHDGARDHGRARQPELGVELTNSFCRTDPEIAKNFARVTFLSDNRATLSGWPRLP